MYGSIKTRYLSPCLGPLPLWRQTFYSFLYIWPYKKPLSKENAGWLFMDEKIRSHILDYMVIQFVRDGQTSRSPSTIPCHLCPSLMWYITPWFRLPDNPPGCIAGLHMISLASNRVMNRMKLHLVLKQECGASAVYIVVWHWTVKSNLWAHLGVQSLLTPAFFKKSPPWLPDR